MSTDHSSSVLKPPQAPPRLSFIVLRTECVVSIMEFYTALGFVFRKEKHGDGPVHYACERPEFVLEVYPGSPGLAPDWKQGGTTMLGFAIGNMDLVLASLRTLGIQDLPSPKPTDQGRRVLLTDPDGRSIELTESK